MIIDLKVDILIDVSINYIYSREKIDKILRVTDGKL